MRNHTSPLLWLALWATLLTLTPPAHAGKKAVLELFTSQGCSSCPPADALAGKLNSKDTLVLSYHVDYWDYLGWKDTNAKPEFSKRQRAYASIRGDKAVYTPQTIINGQTHAVGSNKEEIEKSQANQNVLSITPTLELNGDLITMTLPQSHFLSNTSLWLVTYTKAITVPIKHGENTGKSITYTNVVRTMQPLGMWDGKPHKTAITKADIITKNEDGLALLIQQTKDGAPERILGAATLDNL